jgi:hypothetical protein
MIIQHAGRYRATKHIYLRSSFCCSRFCKGGVFIVTQIDFRFHKIYSPQFGIWVYWDISCEKYEEGKPDAKR